ncbi:MAG: hypothetical protein HY900_30110 [Deltaproteobacteria bacterium]|nr:hypothetical protein [Deltaproteobacteria bacterium]
MAEPSRLVLEVIYKADYCIPCVYMDEAVREVLPRYPGVDYRKVAFMESTEHKRRFTELSIALFGKEKVHRMEQLAPIPSIFIDGKLVFDMIPPRFELEAAIERALLDKDPTRHH